MKNQNHFKKGCKCSIKTTTIFVVEIDDFPYNSCSQLDSSNACLSKNVYFYIDEGPLSPLSWVVIYKNKIDTLCLVLLIHTPDHVCPLQLKKVIKLLPGYNTNRNNSEKDYRQVYSDSVSCYGVITLAN